MKIKIPKIAIYIFLSVIFVIVGVRWVRGKVQPNQQTTQPSISNQEIREIEVTAKQFEFSPNPIRVKLGENVRLKITSIDVTHGFSLPEFGINETLNPNETVSVEFQATKKGEFPFTCSVFCGSGHTGMKGTLIVE
jgi:heme/copper-type cytochrome/quinol oxidase subunit 2